MPGEPSGVLPECTRGRAGARILIERHSLTGVKRAGNGYTVFRVPDMSPLAERVADVVSHNAPHVFCFKCLAAQQGLNEHDVRAVALVLVARRGLSLVRGVCHWCRHTDEGLVSRNAA